NFDTYDASGTGKKLRLTGGLQNAQASATFPLNTWNQVLVIHYKDSTRFYQNSAYIGKELQKNILTNPLTARIGGSHSTTNYFNGKIDEVRVYNRALCDLEIKIVYGTILTLGVKASTPSVCLNTGTTINIVSPQPYMQYRLLRASDSSQVGSMQTSPCSDTLRFATGNLTTSQSYILRATDPTNNQSIYLDTVIAITITPLYNDTIDTIVCGSNGVFFNGQTRYNPGYYVGNFKSKAGCDSIITLHLIKDGSIEYKDSLFICRGDSVFLQNAYRKTANTYYDTIPRPGNCDSIRKVLLNIYAPVEKDTVDTIVCGSVFFDGQNRFIPGYYTGNYLSETGCDSIVVLHIIKGTGIVYDDSVFICNGDSMFLQKGFRKTAGIFYDTIQRTNNCDSIRRTNLKIISSFQIHKTFNICSNDSVLVNGKYLKNAGFYYDTLTSSGGCDSIISTEITVKPAKTANRQVTICGGDSIKISSNYYKADGIYDDSVFVANCLDSIISVQLSVVLFQHDTAVIELCEGNIFQVNGKPVVTSGTYIDSLKNQHGCDSFMTYFVNISSFKTTPLNFEFCYLDSISYNGAFYSNDTTFYDTLKTSGGCDSIVITRLIPGGYAPAMPDSAFYCENKVVALNAGDDYTSYLWNTGSTSSTINAATDGFYWVIVEDSFNCTFTDSVSVIERCGPRIFMPTSFTPNGDGLNDFLLLNAADVDNITFKLFDRWGELVFESNNPHFKWDATYKGDALPGGIYIWTCSYSGRNNEGRTIKKTENGTLHLIR
ncbi:MAG TPA: gliding motility-associated C-terminal domain-containing protein, partial [Bacteroidia bacterium]|nr:gliding motility-associated C-terminal domain-containing protein [Bacteroidia bacterium]